MTRRRDPHPPSSGSRFHFALLTLTVLVALGAALSACGGSSSAGAVSFPTVQTLGACDVCPDVRNTALAVGSNRVLIGLTDNNSRPILDAKVHARFYDLNGDKPVLTSQADTVFEPVQLSYVNEDDGGQKTVTGDDGVYVVDATFPRSGSFGVQLDVTRGGKTLKPIPFTFSVRDQTPEPAVGDPAPASVQMTTATQPDITQIDSSSPPRPAMHNITVADALKTGKPLVIAFATPAFCTSRLCGPIMDTVMDPLAATYAGRAIFIHIEPYDLTAERDTGQQIPVPAMRQWGLQSEPWIFVVDTHGKIAAKYEGIASAAEVGAALQRTFAPATTTPAATGASTSSAQ